MAILLLLSAWKQSIISSLLWILADGGSLPVISLKKSFIRNFFQKIEVVGDHVKILFEPPFDELFAKKLEIDKLKVP
jgi:hypothetical protein